MSLLAKFFNQIKSSQEDIASEGLTHILQNSDFAKEVVNQQIRTKTGVNLPYLNYETQRVKKDLGRTDISGIDVKGKEIVIFEAKFWASLTENQPNSYLNRLENNSVLVFICPELRKVSLYKELGRRLNEQQVDFKSNEELLEFDLTDNKHIVIWSWIEILELLKAELKINQQEKLVSDIIQLIDFCEIVDKNSFIPLSEKELSPEIGRRVVSYYDLVDDIISKMLKKEHFNSKGLTQSAKKYKYYLYRNYYEFVISFGINFELWASSADTPFWLKIEERDKNNNKVEQTPSLRERLINVSKKIRVSLFQKPKSADLFFPIYPKMNEDKAIVIKDMIKQIDTIFDELNNQSNNS